MTTKTPEQRQATDRRNAVTDAAEALAEYLCSYRSEDTEIFFANVIDAVSLRIAVMATEAAKEAALDAKAEEAGLRY